MVFEFREGKVVKWRTYEDTAYMNATHREKIEHVQGRGATASDERPD
jgi:hypothetical protein